MGRLRVTPSGEDPYAPYHEARHPSLAYLHFGVVHDPGHVLVLSGPGFPHLAVGDSVDSQLPPYAGSLLHQCPLTLHTLLQSESYQEDIYPPTAGAQPSLTAYEWLNGMNRGEKGQERQL